MNFENTNICRTCLNNTPNHEHVNISPDEDSISSVLEMLSFAIPELNIYLVKDPVICKRCLNLLKLCFNFKTECLRNEEHLLKHSQNNNTNINIRDVPPPRFRKRPIDEGDPKIINVYSTAENSPPCNESYQINPLSCEKCSGCKFKLLDPSRHLKVLVPPVTCYKCHKETVNIQEMRKHMLNHFRQRKCKICHKYFRDLAQLKIHLRVHTGAYPYKCNLCEKSFRQKHSLTQHLHQHTGSESVSCNYCNKVFSTKYNAKVHIRTTHRAFQRCDLCGETFSTKQQLVKHLETSTESCRGGEIKLEFKEEVEDVQVDDNQDFIKSESDMMEPITNTQEIIGNTFFSEVKEGLI